MNTTFADSAQSRYSEFCPVEAGRGPFRGNQPLANSKGELATGYWQLFVENTESNERSGLIRDFSLTITGAGVTQFSFSPEAIVNSASLDAGLVAPGELVSIYGVALGQAALKPRPRHCTRLSAGQQSHSMGLPRRSYMHDRSN